MGRTRASLLTFVLIPLAITIAWANSDRFWTHAPTFRSEAVEGFSQIAQNPVRVREAMVGLAHLSNYNPAYPPVGECGTGMDEAYAARTRLKVLALSRPETLLSLLQDRDLKVRVAAIFTAQDKILPGSRVALEQASRKDADTDLRRHASAALKALDCKP